MLGWLWRRLYGSEAVAAATPRRLVYVLPQGSLTEPMAAQAGEWLTRLGLIEEVALHLVPGADLGGPRWRRDMHRLAIVIGCADYLVSKALNHGYGVSPSSYPIDFALVTNGAQWVFDDVVRCQRSASMVRQLASAAAGRTAEPFAVTCLRAAPVRAHRGDPEDIAAAVVARHRPGARTQVLLESVAAARRAYAALADCPASRVLVHSQFRGRERRALAEALVADPGDSGQLVITAAVPQPVPARPPVRLPNMTDLFDADLFDAAVPVAEFLDNPGGLEAQLVWATWSADGPPPEEARLPADEWRCRAPLVLIDALADRALVWRIDKRRGGWTALNPAEPARPGEILLVAAADGGYDPVLGFDPAIRAAVGDSPSVDPGPAPSPGVWVSLRQHSEETRDQAVALLAEARPELPDAALRAVECAAYLHDVGKAHPTWQDALCALGEDDRERIEAGRPWAKSGLEAPLVFAGDVSFRHELASLLLIDGPLSGLVDGSADRDLVRFLVLAHHGRLRLRVPDEESAESTVIHGLEHGATWPIPPVLDQPPVKLTADLEQFASPAWTSTVLRLLDRYGPFTLAYLETLVRVADWRSSGGESLATAVPLESQVAPGGPR